MLISRNGRCYRTDVGLLLMQARVQKLQGRLSATLELCPPDNRARDIDNIFKALFDALQHGGAFWNDRQIRELHARFGEVAKPGKVRVELVESTDGKAQGETDVHQARLGRGGE
jgi:crossover junction endodeoxyribonuclease RusA